MLSGAHIIGNVRPHWKEDLLGNVLLRGSLALPLQPLKRTEKFLWVRDDGLRSCHPHTTPQQTQDALDSGIGETVWPQYLSKQGLQGGHLSFSTEHQALQVGHSGETAGWVAAGQPGVYPGRFHDAQPPASLPEARRLGCRRRRRDAVTSRASAARPPL